ncbi:hypothetical protein BH18ACT16_BH18ACT16_10940 [soil metagenome]
MAELPRGTVTFVFTDIEGSTRLLNSLGPDYQEVLASHRTLLREAFQSHGGIEVDTQGDSFFYAWARAQDAVLGAVAAQRALTSHDFGDGVELRVRMGVHTGEPARTQEGYVGPDVHLGSRICSIAWGGQIVVSSATAAVFSGHKEVTLRPLGDHSLKDIDERISLHQVVVPGLSEDFPALRSVGAHPTNLPPRLPVLIGRDQDVIALAELVTSPEVSVVTLVGPGGTGKTRLSLAVAAETLSSFADGAFFVDLSALSDSSLVIASIAQTLSLRETPKRSLEESLADHLASKEMLLVLDNFEQVMGAASQLFSLLERASALKVLVTSRESLRIFGERVVSVAPLRVPSPANRDVDVVASSPAVALFVARAQAVKGDFSLCEDNAADVADICRRLDGLPLALELAAARINLLSPSSLLARLDQGLKVLSAGRRDASDRQRTLRGAIAWSYELLSEDEQRLFRHLAVFAGTWSLGVAEAVCDGDDLERDVLDGLASLVDKSLIRVTDTDEDRFSMLETIQSFALERLEESGEAEEVRRSHARFFRALAEEAEPHLVGEDQTEWLNRLEVEHANLRAALGWGLENDAEALSLAAAIWRFWDIRGYLSEGRKWLDRALDHEEVADEARRAHALYGAGNLAERQGDYVRAVALMNKALIHARRAGDERQALSALVQLAHAALFQGDSDRALELAEAAVEAAEDLKDDDRTLAMALVTLGNVVVEMSLHDRATNLYERALRIWRRLGDDPGICATLASLGELAALSRDLERGKLLLDEAVAIARSIGDAYNLALALVNRGWITLLEDDAVTAAKFFEESIAETNEIGSLYLRACALEGLSASAVLRQAGHEAGRLYREAQAIRKQIGVPPSLVEEELYAPFLRGARELVGNDSWHTLTRVEPSA